MNRRDFIRTTAVSAAAGYPLERRDIGIDQTGGLHALEGYSLLPILRDASPPAGDRLRSRPLFWSHTDNHAVRHGRWKLVSSSGRQSWELYDMHADQTQTSNLAADNPDRVGELADMHQRWADRVGVLPWSEYRSIQRTLRNG